MLDATADHRARAASEAELKSELKSFWAKATLLLFALALVAVASELCLRSGLVYTRYYSHVSSQGALEAPEKKLLILGDSFLDPRGEIGDLLVASLRPLGIEFLNLAGSGMGPLEYLWELETHGRDFAPDIVLLSYYVGNDLTDVQYRLEANPEFATGRSLRDRLRPLARSFYLYHFLTEKRRALRPPRVDEQGLLARGIDPRLVEAAVRLEINPSLFELAIRWPHHLLDGVLLETEANQQAWQRVTETLDRIHALCDELGAELIAIVFPRSIQISDSHFEFFAELGFELDERTLRATRPQDLLMDYCEQRKLRCLDLLPEFKLAGEDLYRPRDDHLNRAGNELAVRSIAEIAGAGRSSAPAAQ